MDSEEDEYEYIVEYSIEFFDKKSGDLLSQRPFKLKEVNFDETFKAVNNGIPQVSLSAVSDAADYVFDIIKNLAERPADDLVFNQVIKHFERIIDEHQEANEIEEAIELTNGLFNKLEELGNANGVSQFGLRIGQFYESEERFADSARFRLESIPKLIVMGDLQATKDFVDNTIELFAHQLHRYLDAATVSVDFLEFILRKKDLVLAMKYVQQASEYYQKSKLPRALADHNFKYGKLYVQLLGGDEPEGFFDIIEEEAEGDEINEPDLVDLINDEEDPFAEFEDEADPDEPASDEIDKDKQIESIDKNDFTPQERFNLREKAVHSLLDQIVDLFKGAIDVYEEEKDRFEIIDTLTEIILLFRKYNFIDQEVIFGEKGVAALSQYDQPDRALRLSLQLLKKLLVKDGNDFL